MRRPSVLGLAVAISVALAAAADAARAALAVEVVELELTSATVDGVAVDDTPASRRFPRLHAPATIELSGGELVSFEEEE